MSSDQYYPHAKSAIITRRWPKAIFTLAAEGTLLFRHGTEHTGDPPSVLVTIKDLGTQKLTKHMTKLKLKSTVVRVDRLSGNNPSVEVRSLSPIKMVR